MPSRVAVTLLVLAAWFPRAAFAQGDDWFAKDKAAHFGATLGISVGSYAGAALAADSERWRALTGIGAGLGAGAAKELWDRSHSGTPSWRDFTWSALGTAAGVAVSWLIDRARGSRASPARPRAMPLAAVSF